jgi:hypothetical protein
MAVLLPIAYIALMDTKRPCFRLDADAHNRMQEKDVEKGANQQGNKPPVDEISSGHRTINPYQCI